MSHSVLPLLLFSVWINCHNLLASNSTPPTLENITMTNGSNKVILKLLVALPLDQTTDYEDPKIQIWDRGLEILPGAQLAVEAINKDPRLLTGYELKLKNVSIDPCIDLEVQTNFNILLLYANGRLDDNTVGIVGLFCHNLLHTLSPLAGRREFGLFQLSGTTSTDVRENRERYSHLNFAVPSEGVYYETFFRLLNALGWRRALIIDDNFFNMIHILNFSMITQNFNISNLEFFDDVYAMANEIRLSEKNIVFVSAGAKQTASLLCAVYDDRLLWPHYMWVLQGHEVNDLLRYAHGECTTEKLMASLQNVLFLRFQQNQMNTSKELVTGSTYETYMQQYTEILNKSGGRLKYNRYANTMHDSVWAFALALNRSLDTIATYNTNVVDFVKEFGREQLTNTIEDNLRFLSFEGVSGRMEFNLDFNTDAYVYITLSDNDGMEVNVGYYDQLLGRLYMNKSLLPSDITSDKLRNIYNRIPIPVTVLLIILVIFCLLLTTIMFFLFFKYRKYSEIKATSPYLSLLMFVGTYFILISTLMQAILMAITSPTGVISSVLCGGVITGNVIGINLIFSTVLLRMLRVYHIFSYFGKTGKYWSDKCLAIIVLLVIGGDAVLLLIWFFADPFTVIENIIYVYKFASNPRTPYYQINQYCSSDKISVWFSLTFGKVGILFAIVLLLAIKTRKIQRANFKDTKKVNIYIFITVLIVATLIPLWFFLKETGNVIWTGVVIYLSFGLTGLFNQIMLFSPKVIPIVLRSLKFPIDQPRHKRYCKPTIRRKNYAIPFSNAHASHCSAKSKTVRTHMHTGHVNIISTTSLSTLINSS